jgi:hypothetical protein
MAIPSEAALENELIQQLSALGMPLLLFMMVMLYYRI